MDEFTETSPFRQVDTANLAKLNAHAAEHGQPAVTDEGINALDPNAIHQGVALQVAKGGLGEAEEHGGRRVGEDAWIWVAWAAMLADGGGNGMYIGCRASAYFALDPPEERMPDEWVEQLIQGSQSWMRGQQERHLSDEDMRRLLEEGED